MTKDLHFRKFAPIDREHSIFELVEGDNVLLDVAMSDAGAMEVAFHAAATNKIFTYANLLEFLAEGRRLGRRQV